MIPTAVWKKPSQKPLRLYHRYTAPTPTLLFAEGIINEPPNTKFKVLPGKSEGAETAELAVRDGHHRTLQAAREFGGKKLWGDVSCGG